MKPSAKESGSSLENRDEAPKIGLLAGAGRYPLIVAEELKRQGYRTYCLGLKDHADPVIGQLCEDFGWVGLAQLGGAIRYFRRHGVKHVAMAGKLHKILFFQPWVWLKHMPDWRAVRRFFPHFGLSRNDLKDDTLLGAIIDEFALDGIGFKPATDFVPELLVQEGQLTRRGPSRAQWRDIDFGWTLAKESGRLDIGQSVAVKQRAVLAVEAIEGTDECIKRAGQLCTAGGFTVVKVAKPKQDLRFDMPTIGCGTLQSMVAAGGRILAIEAGQTIVLDQSEVIEYANRNNIVVVAVNKPRAKAA